MIPLVWGRWSSQIQRQKVQGRGPGVDASGIGESRLMQTVQSEDGGDRCKDTNILNKNG